MQRPVALTIAGSDSGGGAGVQADLRVFSRLGAFGTSAVTALTAQNLSGVHDVFPVSPEHVKAQLEAVLSGFSVQAAKTGMLWSADLIATVARVASEHGDVRHWVVDPVMVATSGTRLLQPDAVQAYEELLLPRATVITPNLDEAAVLLRTSNIGRSEMMGAARALRDRYGCAVLLKGGHLDGEPSDILVDGEEVHLWEHPRREQVNSHGTGCMLSAAIAAFLARGERLVSACELALAFLQGALAAPHRLAGDVRLAGVEPT